MFPMLADVWTVWRKEVREMLRLYGSGRLGVLGLAAIPLVFGIFLPWQMGRAWVESPVALLFWAWLPPFLALSLVADAVAGERERHTLESLLATRLPDAAILLGKMGAAVAYACVVAWFGFALGLVTVNVAHGRGGLLLYSPLVVAGTLALTVLLGGLAATGGVLLSLRVATVRRVQQGLGMVIFVLAFLPGLVFQMLPAGWRAWATATATSVDPALLLVEVVVALSLLDAALLAFTLSRFRRSRLIAV